MKLQNLLFLTVLITLITACGKQMETPRLGGWDYDWMKQVKNELNKGETFYLPAYENLLAEVDYNFKLN